MDVQAAVLLQTERRDGQRLGVTLPALIYVRDGLPLCPCMVLDVSEGGGRIRVDAKASVPDHFFLLFTRAGTVRRACRVVWRHDPYLGVSFSSRFDHFKMELNL